MKIVGIGVLKLKMSNIGRGFFLLMVVCSFLSLFSCKDNEDIITSADWVGNWTIVESRDMQQGGEYTKPYTGTIKMKASDKDAIVMSGSLFDLPSSEVVEAEVDERVVSFDKRTDDYRIAGTGELKNTNEARFEFSILKDNETKSYTRIAVKIQ